jgi:transmembrane sensor
MDRRIKMEENSTYYVDLINRYFAGEASPDEMQALSIWLKSDQKNQEQFNEFQKTWVAIDQNKINSAIDIEEEWNKINLIIEPSVKREKEVKIIQLDTHHKQRPNLFLKYSRIAAVFVLLAVSASVIYFLLRKSDQPKTIRLLAKTESIEKKLPDGTFVTLNTGSINYPEEFEGKKRIVKLQGEAYFKVTHDKERPFIIEAGEIMVEDIGTSFYVNTNATKGNVEVILTSGSVAVYYKNKPKERTILNPGEKAEFSKASNKIAKSENNDENYMAFKTKKLVFSDTPLNEIVETLNKVYHADIKIKDIKVADCHVTTSFDNQTLDAVLNVLKATIDVNINKSGSGIEITGNGCK